MIRNLGTWAIIGGVVLLGFSFYINQGVGSGKQRISSAQREVDMGNSLFSTTSTTKPIGKLFTGSAQDKIDQGQQSVDYYENLSSKLQIGGIVLLIAGVGYIFLNRRKRRH